MKPCTHHKKNLVLLAAGVLESAACHPLRQHLLECPGCRRYWQEISEICNQHSSAMEGQPRLEASDEFHRRLVRRIQTDDHVPRYGARSPIFDWLIASRWKIAFSTAAAALLVAGALQFRLQIEPALPISSNSKPKAVAVPRADFQPSFLAYRQAVNKSPEALDALLALDATKSTGSVRAITAAMRELAGLTD